MQIIKQNEARTEEIARKLELGQLIIMPTETTYGAMVDARNPAAVEKLTLFKNRPFGKPYSIAVTNIQMAKKYAVINDTAKNIYEKFLPGPVTIISKAKKGLARGIVSEKGTVGIRIPDYKLVIDVIKILGRPVTATSANASYKKRPYKIEDILNNISEKQKGLIDLIIDAGELLHREPSTVIDTTLDDVVTLRQGEIIFNDQFSIFSDSEEKTQNAAKELWQKYEQHAGQRAIIFALEGPMGAGKTQFVKGLARAMGIVEVIQSPTFVLENRYANFSHIDAWRMEDTSELESLDFKKLVTDKSVIAIEWADRVSGVIRKYNEEAIIIWVKIEYPSAGSGQANENERKISWTTR